MKKNILKFAAIAMMVVGSGACTERSAQNEPAATTSEPAVSAATETSTETSASSTTTETGATTATETLEPTATDTTGTPQQ